MLKDFYGPNAGYVMALYERFRQAPQSFDEATQAAFERWRPSPEALYSDDSPPTTAAAGHIVGAVNLAWAIREYGHLAAQLDPLGSSPPGAPVLQLEYHNLAESDLRQLPASLVGGPAAEKAPHALAAIQALRAVYSATSGHEYEHVRNHSQRDWLLRAAESRRFRPTNDDFDAKNLLARLTEVEVFEQFLQRVFPGKTRFSVEGLDMLIPILDAIVGQASQLESSAEPLTEFSSKVSMVLIGMAHRGRLNVLTHIMGCPYEQILVEFKDPDRSGHYDSPHYRGWTGDVKYHAGARREIGSHSDLTIRMPANPSHLEHVNPVVAGMALARGSVTVKAGAPEFDPSTTLPILIHGDAAFPAQGVVAESLNLSKVPGYQVGGTIHIIANNQIGFTTNPDKGRSTLYASDLAKGFEIPIIHVNADDPLACLEAARLAIAYRHRFQKDFLIDLVGYRRHGHNEGDEPRFTQPRLYRLIDDHPSVRAQWADRLISDELIGLAESEKMVRERTEELRSLYESLQVETSEDLLEPNPHIPPEGAARQVKTAVPAGQLRQLNAALLEFPDGFNLHPKLERGLKRRWTALEQADETTIDWATAESLALSSILADGTAIRLTGQDTQRGTFSQRHAVFHDTETQQIFVPLQAFSQAKAAFEVLNSPLSESAAVGFEYGYSIESQNCLVVWEAQYGDFINGAQAMIEQFIISGKDKWGQLSALVLLLPHGFEGQGPDHSTGRIESFLPLAVYHNIRVAYPTTPAQYFHLLRRQAALLEEDPLPLFIMTPKSLLRHPRAKSSLKEFAEGRWQPVIDDPRVTPANVEQIRRLLLCSGKFYVELVDYQDRLDELNVAVARVEQLYAFPEESLNRLLDRYPGLEDVIWVQEEPANMGAWEFIQPCLKELIDDRWPLSFIGRPRRASPAEGSLAWHKRKQEEIVEQAFALD
jgi:2-oxoglutarate dehydrogenase E1 component